MRYKHHPTVRKDLNDEGHRGQQPDRSDPGDDLRAVEVGPVEAGRPVAAVLPPLTVVSRSPNRAPRRFQEQVEPLADPKYLLDFRARAQRPRRYRERHQAWPRARHGADSQGKDRDRASLGFPEEDRRAAPRCDAIKQSGGPALGNPQQATCGRVTDELGGVGLALGRQSVQDSPDRAAVNRMVHHELRSHRRVHHHSPPFQVKWTRS